jgi:lycopene beta-cyclase
MKQYDYIFTGAGLSALMTVYKMVVSGKFEKKRILLLDKNTKQTNDRTWCFWSENKSIWGPSISKKWDSALFANADFQRNLELHPYQYNKIQGLEFYNQVLELIAKQKNIDFVQEKVFEIEESESIVLVKTETQSFSCSQQVSVVTTAFFRLVYPNKNTCFQSRTSHFYGFFGSTKKQYPLYVCFTCV